MGTVRTLLSWRLLAAVAALAGLALLVNAVFVDDDEIEAVLEPTVIERQIDLVAPVFAIERADDFALDASGVTTGAADLVLDERRTARITAGTPGEVTCDELDAVDRCAVFADLLGEAVVWFALVPQAPGGTAEVAPIVDLDEGDAVLDDGWRIPYAPVIERECGDVDIPSFVDFLERFGSDSVTIVDLEVRQVVAARCADPAAAG